MQARSTIVAHIRRHYSTALNSTVCRSNSSFKHSQGLLASGVVNQIRHLNLHEYQSKGLMAKFDIRVQKGLSADTPDEAQAVAQKLLDEGAAELVVKAQIHAGGRGKGFFDNGFKGGVHITSSATKVASLASSMLGNNLITKQTGPEGQMTSKLLIHEGIDFDRELYLAFVMDRAYNGPVLVCSTQGGMDIEEVSESDPDAIKTMPIDIMAGIQPEQTKWAADILGFEGKSNQDAQEQIKNLYKLFVATDCTQLEINPLVQTKDGLVYCVDAKLNFDESADYRQQEIFEMRDTSMEDAREVAASKFNLNYIGLDGEIGCMVNGAGLAMATMDIIKLHGGSPANFLDVGGGATESQVEEAFKIISGDSKVKAVLVNIFGGIMKCDVISAGIVKAAEKIGLDFPLIVRLEGTNVEKGNQILKDSGLNIITAADLDDAAIKAVAAIQ